MIVAKALCSATIQSVGVGRDVVVPSVSDGRSEPLAERERCTDHSAHSCLLRMREGGRVILIKEAREG